MGRGRDRDGQRPPGAIAGVLGGAVARPVFVPAPFWPGALLGQLRDRILADAQAEAASGRLILWLPVLFGCGILLYFGAAQEPSLPAALGLAGVLALAALVARARPVTFALLLGAAAISAGFALATLQTARISHPVLPPPPGLVRLSGFIEQVERRPKADRVLLRVTAAEGRGLVERPGLVRLSLGRGTAPPAGTPVSILARLLPPVEAVLPGGHDFGRGIWFRGIDAVGFGLGRPRVISPPGDPPLSVRLGTMIEEVRRAVGARIRQSLSGTAADIAVALVVGDRASVAPEVEESMRVSGLTHVLSISGLHMAMVAGTLFFLVRGLLAAVPPLALGFPIKSAAALAALGGSGIYLLLSGNDWPAQRSFFMLGIVLVGVMAGRSALTLRTVAVAAMLVLALGPQAILEAGTQMSFAATLALVAAYEHWSSLRARPAKGALVWQLAARAGLFLAALSLTSVVAGAATAPYAALHFQRVGVFGLLANLCAMPAVEFLVMPFGLMGVLLMPFGWDFIAWPVMGWGLDIMVRVSDMVAALPGADTRTDWVGPGAAGAATIALLCLCLLRGWLAALAIPPAVAAVLLLGPAPRPDVLIAPNGQTVAVRGSDGKLSVTGARSNRLAVEQWLSREADPRTAESRDLAAGFICDADACRAPLPGGGILAVSRRPEGLAAACREVAILVTPVPTPKDCGARVFSPGALARTGTVALFRKVDGSGRTMAAPADTGTAAPDAVRSPGPLGQERGMGMDAAPAVPGPGAGADAGSPVVDEPGLAPSGLAGPDGASAGIAGPPRPRHMAADHRASLRRQSQADRAAVRSQAMARNANTPSQPGGSVPGGADADGQSGTGRDAERAGIGGGRAAAGWSLGGAGASRAEQDELRRTVPSAAAAHADPSAAAPAGPASPRPQGPPASSSASARREGNASGGTIGPSPVTGGDLVARPVSRPSAPPPGAAQLSSQTYAARWREVPTRVPGVQRPWMPVLPALAAADEALDVPRAEDDARGAPD